MSAYLLVKCLHIVSAVLLVGTGFGSAFYLYFANRTGNVQAVAVVSRLVVRADNWFTLPAVIFQPLSGLWLMERAGWSLGTPWIAAALLLYLLAGACWLPVVVLQVHMRNMAAHAALSGTPLPDRYGSFARWWEGLGYPAFGAMLAVFYLMVMKPQ